MEKVTKERNTVRIDLKNLEIEIKGKEKKISSLTFDCKAWKRDFERALDQHREKTEEVNLVINKISEDRDAAQREAQKSRKRLHDEIEEKKSKVVKLSQESARWRKKYLNTATELAANQREIKRLKTERRHEMGMHDKFQNVLFIVVNNLMQKMSEQREYIFRLVGDYNGLVDEYHGLCERHEDLAWDHKELQQQEWLGRREQLGRHRYIEHLRGQIFKAMEKAEEMTKEVEALRQEINPVGQYGQRVLNFLDSAKDQYEQVVSFFGCNSNMMRGL